MGNKYQLTPILRYSGFSEEWENKKLGDIGKFKNGINKDKSQFGFGVPFVNLMDVFGKHSISSKIELEKVNANQQEIINYSLVKGDVIFIRSSVKRSGVGETVIILDDLMDTVYSGFLIRFRESSNILDAEFMKHYFMTSRFRKELISYSTTSANTNINQESLKLLDVFFPKLPEQNKIASFLTSVDFKLEQIIKKKECLEKYKKGMMQKLFSQEIRFNDEEGNNYPDWEKNTLSEYLELCLRKEEKPDSHYLAIGVRSHMKGTFQKPNSDPSKIAMKELYVVKENDLVVNITFAWEGAIAIVSAMDDGGYVSHRFPTYICKVDKLLTSYIKQVILEKRFKYNLDLISPGGAGRNRVLSKKEFMKMQWIFPSLPEQQKIADFLSSIDDKIERVGEELEKAKTFKKGILQQMFV